MKKNLLLILVLFITGCSLFKSDIPEPELKTQVTAPINPGQLQCLDTLGIAAYPSMAKQIPLNIMIRGFHKTFGDYLKVMRKELARGRPVIGVGGPWNDHIHGDSDIPEIKKLGAELKSMLAAYPGKKIYWSVFVEHNLNNFDKYGDIAQAACPQCIIVNSVYKGSFSKKYQNEVHGSSKKPTGVFLVPGVSYSSDGSNSPDQNFTKIVRDFKDAVFVCGWHWSFNLFYGASDPASRATRIKEKKERKPTKDIINSIIYLFLEPGQMNLSSKIYLLKSHAEKHDFQDTKGNKMMIITKVKTAFVEFRKQGFNIKLPLFGSFSGCKNCWRYYWTQFGFKAGEALDVIINGKKEGTVNGGVRCCHYQ